MVDIRAVEAMKRPVTLDAIKADPRLTKMALVTNSRLSMQPVSEIEWQIISCRRLTAPAGGRSSWEPAGQTKAIADVERHQREIDGAIGKLDCLDGVEESPKVPARREPC
jgi:hypothetical protein